MAAVLGGGTAGNKAFGGGTAGNKAAGLSLAWQDDVVKDVVKD